MKIPKAWTKTIESVDIPGGKIYRLVVWGWGDDEASAKAHAAKRRDELVRRVRAGSAPPDEYQYAALPLREERLRELDASAASDFGSNSAVVTRNRYGAEVLNSADALILDLDLPEEGGWRRLLHRLGVGQPALQLALERLRALVIERPGLCFRVYRTAAGLRAIEVNRNFLPNSDETRELMRIAGCDPLYVKLCRVQESFRARLTPKPWRCGLRSPPGVWPRETPAQQAAFEAWLAQYDAASARYAVCRFLETVGTPLPGAANAGLIAFHDQATGALDAQARPLA